MTPTFEVSSFEQIQATPGTALLRIAGQWLGPVRERLAPPLLVIDDGRRAHRIAALPGPDDANPLSGPDPRPWRAAYAAPQELLGGRCAFALDVGRGGLIDLPRPGARAAVHPAGPPAIDDRAAREEQERAHTEQALRTEQQRLADEDRERERLRVVREQHLAGQREREQALEAERARREAERAQEAERQAQATRGVDIARTAALREEQLRRAQQEREAELRRAQAALEADAARAKASRDAAARRIGELEQRIDGYRDMLAQATEALALANGRLEADAQDLVSALDVAAVQAAQREQAEADALASRAALAELEAEHAQALRRASSAESELAREQIRVAEPSADPAELEELHATVAHERAVADRLRDAYSQESAARAAEVAAWHEECEQAVKRAEQLAEALAGARLELERLHDPSGLGIASGGAPARGLIRFASKD